MAKIFVRTDKGELIELIEVDQSYNDDDHSKEYIMFLIDLAIYNALSIDAGTLAAVYERQERTTKNVQ